MHRPRGFVPIHVSLARHPAHPDRPFGRCAPLRSSSGPASAREAGEPGLGGPVRRERRGCGASGAGTQRRPLTGASPSRRSRRSAASAMRTTNRKQLGLFPVQHSIEAGGLAHGGPSMAAPSFAGPVRPRAASPPRAGPEPGRRRVRDAGRGAPAAAGPRPSEPVERLDLLRSRSPRAPRPSDTAAAGRPGGRCWPARGPARSKSISAAVTFSGSSGQLSASLPSPRGRSFRGHAVFLRLGWF